MNLTTAAISATLLSRAVPVSESLPTVGKRLKAAATIGTTQAVDYPLANVTYICAVSSQTGADTCILDLITGLAVADAGSPDIKGSGVDFSGVALPAAGIMHAIKILAPSTNVHPISLTTIIGSAGGSISLLPGMTVLLAYASTGVELVTADAITIVFGSATGESIVIEIIAQTPPV